MKFLKFMIAPLLITGLTIVHAEDLTDQPTQEQYQAAIASFGINESASEIASREAVEIAREKRQDNEANPLAHLPSDWLEGSPY